MPAKHIVNQFCLCLFFLFVHRVNAQICATPGADGPTNSSNVVNTYFPPSLNTRLTGSSRTVDLQAVPLPDAYGTSYGNTPISAGDLLLFIQMQDGDINNQNQNLYGSGIANSGPDRLGGTGYSNIGNAGLYEYAVALNDVSVSGGTLSFKGAGAGGALVNIYTNQLGDGITRGKKTFQVIRVPQYSSLRLSQNIISPVFNGEVGGVVCIDVAGEINFNGFMIDASGKGFRGGFQGKKLSGCNTSKLYVTSDENAAATKGEGFPGTPQYIWNGFGFLDNGATSLLFPGGSYGKGAAGNGGGGGNDHNAGGGGGGNGGFGGNGGYGFKFPGVCPADFLTPGGGRPGSSIAGPAPRRLLLGGGGGAGDTDDDDTGSYGGTGGGIIIINAGVISGIGNILSDGSEGKAGGKSNFAYNWNGTLITDTTRRVLNLQTAGGCDSIVTFQIKPVNKSKSYTYLTLCPNQLPYVWNSFIINAAGTYNATINGSKGCDSVAYLILTVTDDQLTTDVVDICENQLPYKWNGKEYRTSGTFEEFIQVGPGCKRRAILVLTIFSNSNSVTDLTICRNQIPFSWNGLTNITTDGTYTVRLTNSAGCDSIATLHLKVNNILTSTSDLTICQNQLPFVWNGVTFTRAETKSANLKSVDNCDSIATLKLTVLPKLTSTETITVCPRDLPFTWITGGVSQVLDVSGTYTSTIQNAAGCDSTITLTFKVLPNASGVVNQRICSSQTPYSWGSLPPITTSGTYTDILPASNGCDSVVTLNLIVDPVSRDTTVATICPSDLPFTWRGTPYPQAGIYELVLPQKTVRGCDSIKVLQIILKPTFSTDTLVAKCAGDLPFSWRGQSYNQAGTYSFTLKANNGCDSVINLVLTVPSTEVTRDSTVCTQRLPIIWNGVTIPSPGSYKANLINRLGCDSIVNMNVFATNSFSSLKYDTICANQTYIWGNNSYKTSGRYYNYLRTYDDKCDSVAELNLFVKPLLAKNEAVRICPTQLPYRWRGKSFSVGGTYNDTIRSSNPLKCDSVYSLQLIVKRTDTIIDKVNDYYSCSLPYVWKVNGKTYFNPGTYEERYTNNEGCDSIRRLIFTVKQIGVCISFPPWVVGPGGIGRPLPYCGIIINLNTCPYVCLLPGSNGAPDTLFTIPCPTPVQDKQTTIDLTICKNQTPYIWNGLRLFRDTSITKVFALTPYLDSIVNFKLTVNPVDTSDKNITICQNQAPYLWNGVNYRSTGNYTAILKSSKNCDSIARLHLTVLPTSTGTERKIICSNQIPYAWNGQQLSSAGLYTATLRNSVGCDSVVTLNLTVNPAASSTINKAICNAQVPYSWFGQSISLPGSYFHTIPGGAKNGCDSTILLNLTIKPEAEGYQNLVLCYLQTPFTWNGQTIRTPGIYRFLIPGGASSGCDSVSILDFDTVRIYKSFASVTVCSSQLPYIWNGQSITTAGTYTKMLTGTGGCDSLATLTLNVNPAAATTVPFSICENELPFSWFGQSINSPGNYTTTLTTTLGCDSVITLSVKVNPVKRTTINIEKCPGELPYVWDQSSYTSTGVYEKYFSSAEGCDSIVTLDFVVKPIAQSITNQLVCQERLPFNWNGQSCNGPGTYNFITRAANGCDSIATLVLSVNTVIPSITNVSICSNKLPFIWNNKTFTGPGVFDVVLPRAGANNCDSIAKLNLVVYQVVNGPVERLTKCSRDLPFIWNGKTIAGPGTHNAVLINANGCDSVVILQLTIVDKIENNIEVSVCADITTDGAGGGGAGGTVFLNYLSHTPSASVLIRTNGAKGGNTLNDLTGEHGPGGGGGGGVIWFRPSSATGSNNAQGGKSGLTNNGGSGAVRHGASDGQPGYIAQVSRSNIPTYTQGQGATCIPILSVQKTEKNAGPAGARPAGNNATYYITITNNSNNGAGTGVLVRDSLPEGFTFVSATVSYTGEASGPAVVTNTGTATNPVFGNFYIPKGSNVVITMITYIDKTVLPGIYHNGVQVFYLDPTRTIDNPNRHITPAKFSKSGQNTTYESGTNAGKPVGGTNYDGSTNGPVVEDVHIIAPGTIIPNFTRCEGENVQFDITPPAFSSPFSYIWTSPAGVTLSNNTVKNPQINNVTPADAGDYKVVITDKNGFTSEYTSSLTVSPKPTVDFLQPSNTCLSSNVIIAGIASVPVGSVKEFIWDMGNNTTIRNPSVNYIYTNPGTYNIKLVVVSDKDCKESITRQIVIHPLPNLTVNSPVICEGQQATLTASGAGTYLWEPNINLSSTSTPSVVASPNTTTIYKVTGTNSFGCTATKQTTVTVNPLPDVTLIKPLRNHLCEGVPMTIGASGGNSYQWYFNGNPVSNGTSSQLSVQQPGRYSVEGVSDKGCKKLAATVLDLPLYNKPVPDFDVPFACEQQVITFTNKSNTVSSGPVRWFWDFGDRATSNARNPAHTYENGGLFFVKLQIIPEQCPELSATVTKPVNIEKKTPGIRYPGVLTLKNQSTPLTARPIGNSYLWSPSVGLNTPLTMTPVFKYDREVEYLISIGTQNGCTTKDTLLVRVFADADVQVPTAFSPNGDGKNDRLDVFLIDIKELIVFRVFNRWGQLLFETSDPAQKWDGTYLGKPQPLENYVWLAEAISMSGLKIVRRGQTVLIR